MRHITRPTLIRNADDACVGLSSYTTPAHIALATLEANAFQTRAILESMKLDSSSELKHLKVDGGMTNGDMVMKVLADIGGFTVIRPEMREYVSLSCLFFRPTPNACRCCCC